MDNYSQEVLAPAQHTRYVGDGARDILIVFTVVDIVVVALRFYAQGLRGRLFAIWDDYLILIGLLFGLGTTFLGFAALYTAGIEGSIRHAWVVETAAMQHWAKLRVALSVIYSLACFFPRVVILVMYLQIFVSAKSRYACWTLMTILTCYTLASIIVNLAQCIPLRSLWDPSRKGDCIDEVLIYKVVRIPNPIIDLAMLILPLPVIWNLQMSRKQKTSVMATFLMVIIGTITATIWCVIFFVKANPREDVKGSVPIFLGASTSEPAFYLVTACLLAYRPLFELVREKFKRSRLANEHRRWWAGNEDSHDGEANGGTSRFKNLVPAWATRLRWGGCRSQVLRSREGSAPRNGAERSPESYELGNLNNV